MENRIREAFQSVRADEPLLQRTKQSLYREVESRQTSRPRVSYRRAGMAFAAILLLVLGVWTYRWYQVPGAYVSIDVNPSIELALNHMDRVVGTYGFNAEGEQVLSGVNLQGKRYDEAVEAIFSSLEIGGYLSDGSLVSLSVQSAARSENELEELLTGTVRQQLEFKQVQAEVEVHTVSHQVWEEARSCHISPAKYLAIQELLEVDDDATLEDYSHHSIQQIRTRTRECMEGHSSAGGGRQGQGNGHGHGNRRAGHGQE